MDSKITIAFGPMQLLSDVDCTFLSTSRTWYVLLPKTIFLLLNTAATAWYSFIFSFLFFLVLLYPKTFSVLQKPLVLTIFPLRPLWEYTIYILGNDTAEQLTCFVGMRFPQQYSSKMGLTFLGHIAKDDFEIVLTLIWFFSDISLTFFLHLLHTACSITSIANFGLQII